MIVIEESRLESLLTEATKRGAELAFKRFVRYNYTEAAKLISITPKTLSKYILLGKIKAVDGMVSGEEIDRYLAAK